MASNTRLAMRIVGFFLIFYAFLIIVDPNSYGFGISTELIPLITIVLLFAGAFLILRKGAR